MSHSAVSPIQFGKTLPMFMTPNEIKTHVGTNDQHTDESVDQMWSRKTAESNDPAYSSSGGRTLRERIQRQGMQVPPEILGVHTGPSHPTGSVISNGHHRIAVHAQLHGGDSLMPVEHYDTGLVQHDDAYRHKKKQEIAAKKKPPPPMTSSDVGRVNEIMTGLGFH